MSDLAIVTIVCIPPVLMSLWMIYEDIKYDYEERRKDKLPEEDLQETVLMPIPEVQESDYPWWLDLEAMNDAILNDSETISVAEDDHHFYSRKTLHKKKKEKPAYLSRLREICDRIIYKETESE